MRFSRPRIQINNLRQNVNKSSKITLRKCHGLSVLFLCSSTPGNYEKRVFTVTRNSQFTLNLGYRPTLVLILAGYAVSNQIADYAVYYDERISDAQYHFCAFGLGNEANASDAMLNLAQGNAYAAYDIKSFNITDSGIQIYSSVPNSFVGLFWH